MRTLATILCMLLLASRCSAGGWSGPFFFIQLADPQLGFLDDNRSIQQDAALFERAIEHANRLRPAFVVVCGDLVNIPGSETQAAELLRISRKLAPDIPIHWVAGNHDVGNVPDAASLKWYRDTFGPDCYAFDIGGCRFVVLNSAVVQHPENCPGEAVRQRLWLSSALRTGPGEQRAHTVVFQHHPWFLSAADEPDEYFNIPLATRTIYLGMLRRYSVSAVFAGHRHQNALARDGELEMVTSGPVGRPLGADPSGLRIVKVFQDRIEHSYYGLDDVPARVELGEEH